MFYIVTMVGFLILQSILILSTKININPEIFFLSWLVGKGEVPYRDFFDDHGPLTHYLLSPLSVDKSLFSIKAAYFFISALNLWLVLLIIRKTRSKLGFFLGGLTYVLVMFFVSENDFWFELVITTFYLIVYYLLTINNFKYRDYLIGLFISLATLVKPTAAIIILPLIFLLRSVKLITSFIALLVLSAVWFIINNAFSQLIDNLFSYNFFLTKYYHPSYISDIKFLLFSIFIIILAVIFSLLDKRFKKVTPPLVFVVCSLIFLGTGYTRVRLVPIATFFTILIATSIKEIKSIYKVLFVSLVSIYCLVMVFKVIQHRSYLNSKRVPYIEDKKILPITSYLKKLPQKEKFFILGNYVQPYYFLDQLPPTYFPLRYPLVEKYYPDFEERVNTELRKNQVKVIFAVK